MEFPEIPGSTGSAASVTDHGWVPESEDGQRGDLALLQLHAPPPGAPSAPLVRAVVPPGTPVEMCGYADTLNQGNGAALTATVSQVFGERLQLNPAHAGHVPRRGFSGGPVVDLHAPGAVLGITVTGLGPTPRAGLVLAHMIPVDTVLGHLRHLGRHARGLRGVSPGIAVPASAQQAFEPDYAERLARWFAAGKTAPVYVTEVQPDSVRARTVTRALALADRELAGSATSRTASADPPVGSLGLAVDVRGQPADAVVRGVAERLTLQESSPEQVLERMRRDGLSLTLALLGANLTSTPDALVDVCHDLARLGCRLLVVCHGSGTRIGGVTPARLRVGVRLAALGHRLAGLDALVDRHAAAATAVGVEVPEPGVVRLHENLAGLSQLHRTGTANVQQLTEGVGRLETMATEVRQELRRMQRDTAGRLALRAALRERLETYRSLAHQHIRVEDVGELNTAFGGARAALWVAPLDPEVAQQRLRTYVDLVRTALGWELTGEDG